MDEGLKKKIVTLDLDTDIQEMQAHHIAEWTIAQFQAIENKTLPKAMAEAFFRHVRDFKDNEFLAECLQESQNRSRRTN
jgi:predicted DsbA family dithiol-disulfide isomerase